MSPAHLRRLVELRKKAHESGCMRRHLAYSRLRDDPRLVRVSIDKLTDPAWRPTR